MARAKSENWQRALRLLANNPKMNYETFKELTGYSKSVFHKLKLKTNNDGLTKDELLRLEKAVLKLDVKQRFLKEMKQRMREKYGFINLKHTPLQGRSK